MEERGRLQVVADEGALARAAAETFARCAHEAVRGHGRFAVALAGGSTPLKAYALLADPSARPCTYVPWEASHFFWADERHVPPEHPESNYRAAREALLARVPVPGARVHRIPAENPDAEAAAAAYERDLAAFFAPPAGLPPRFDLVLLGMGADGHTASLFPGSEAIGEQRRWVVAPWIERLRARRITLTPPVINAAADVVFLVSGAGKAETLKQVLQGPPRPERLPAQAIHPAAGRLLWLLDQAAASRLGGAPAPI